MTPRAELERALRRLDARLAREVVRLRARYQLSLDEFRGLYVSDARIDEVLGAAAPAALDLPPLPKLAIGPRLGALARRFALAAPAVELLLLALAADLDPKYAVLTAYLNDDVQRRLPTFDLARRLFGDQPALTSPAGPLFGSGLVRRVEPGAEPCPRPLQAFAAHPFVIAWLLGDGAVSAPGLTLLEPQASPCEAGRLADLAPIFRDGAPPALAVLRGPVMSGRAAAAAALAGALGRPLVQLDLAASFGAPEPRLREAVLAARLAGAILVLEPPPGRLAGLAPALREPQVPTLLMVGEDGEWRQDLGGCGFAEVAFALPAAPERRTLWSEALAGARLDADAHDVTAVADRFRLSSRQIAASAASLRLESRLAPGAAGRVDAEALAAAARAQSSAGLADLATRMAPAHRWDDLVLPAATRRQLARFGAAIRHRETVFAGWGFARGADCGLIALFSGASGTGKSMAASVLGRGAGLEVWRIDLSAVVSKYIGETEKQLERIFSLARAGNAILFFDEADALFGKRSEVKDAHDRYANIEVAFLLQRMEAYDGVAILATNLARNIDRAFSRRTHFIIEFPMPDPMLRERLWRHALPAAAPLADDIDFTFLARQFAFAGGDIRVAALDAAFAAAADDAPIDMARLLQAVARQLQKQGKVAQAPTSAPTRRCSPRPRRRRGWPPSDRRRPLTAGAGASRFRHRAALSDARRSRG
ncbi:MAG TPA: ATP-binding protein [Caulobacteraceae bacterium]|jgi:hypothetical protein